jgi:hypothetical protein
MNSDRRKRCSAKRCHKSFGDGPARHSNDRSKAGKRQSEKFRGSNRSPNFAIWGDRNVMASVPATLVFHIKKRHFFI